MRRPSTNNHSENGAPPVGRLIRAPLIALLALLAILAANVAAAYWSLEGDQLALNIVFALVSVVLIALIFMELKSSGALNRLCAAAGFAWLALFLLLTFGDYLTRIIMPL